MPRSKSCGAGGDFAGRRHIGLIRLRYSLLNRTNGPGSGVETSPELNAGSQVIRGFGARVSA